MKFATYKKIILFTAVFMVVAVGSYILVGAARVRAEGTCRTTTDAFGIRHTVCDGSAGGGGVTSYSSPSLTSLPPNSAVYCVGCNRWDFFNNDGSWGNVPDGPDADGLWRNPNVVPTGYTNAGTIDNIVSRNFTPADASFGGEYGPPLSAAGNPDAASSGSSCGSGGCGGSSESSCSGGSCSSSGGSCQATQTGMLGGGLGNTIGDVIARNIAQNLQNTMQNVGQTLASNLTNQLQSHLRSSISNNIKSQLPGLLSTQINGLYGRGYNAGSIKAQLPNIITGLIRQIITQTVQNDTPGLFQNISHQTLSQSLAQDFSSQVAGAINSSDLPGQINDLAGQSNPFASTTNQNFGSNLTAGVTTAAQNSVAHSAGVDQMASNIASQLADQIVPNLINQILNQFLSSNLYQAGGSSMSGANWDNILTGPGGDLSQGLSGSFLNPVVQGITPGLSTGLASGIAGLQSSILGSNITGNALTGPLATISSDVTGDLSAGSLGITQGAFGNIGVAAYTGFASGITGGISGGLAGLMNGVPVAGPLLAPLVQQVTQQALSQLLLPTTAAAPAFPVSDAGLQLYFPLANQAISNQLNTGNQNTAGINQAAGSMDKNTRTICDLQSKANDYWQNLLKKYFKFDPDARKSTFNVFQSARQAIDKFFATSYQVSPGTVGATGGTPTASGNQSGQNVVAQLEDNKADATKEAIAKNQAITSSAQNPNAKVAAQINAYINATKGAAKLQSSVTQADIDNLSNGEKAAAMKSADFKIASAKVLSLNGNPEGTWMQSQANQSLAVQQAQQNTDTKYIANGGYNETRVCDAWGWEQPVGAPDSSYNTQTGQWCQHWKTLTPGSTNRSLKEKLLLGVLDFMFNTHYFQEDFVNNFVNQLSQAVNVSQSASTAQSTGSDPCPGSSPCSQTGWQGGQSQGAQLMSGGGTGGTVPSIGAGLTNGLATGLGNLTNNLTNYGNQYLNDSLNNALNGSGGSGGSGSNFNFGNQIIGNLIYDLAGNVIGDLSNTASAPAPEIEYFRVVSSGTALENRLGTNGRALEWSTKNTLACQAANDWTETSPEIKQGAVLEATGSASIATTSRSTYSITCYNSGLSKYVEKSVSATP